MRRHSRWIVTNPDMLHRGILPAHQKWSSTLRRVAYVVIDECHAYRGVFGSHVGHVLRRLRRICRRYGAEPVFVLASATVADPAAAASRLVGAPVEAVTDDGSPRPGATFALWEPPLTERTGEHGAPLRRSAAADAADAARRPRGARRPHAGVRAVAAQRGVGGRPGPPAAARPRPRRPGPPGGLLPRRLPARGAAGAGAGPVGRRPARRGDDQRPGARHRHRRARRRRARRLPGHARLALAAGRPGGAGAEGVAGRLRGPRRPAGPLPRPPSPRGVRPADRGDRHRPGQPLRARPAAVLCRGRAAAAPGGPRRTSAAPSRRRSSTSSWPRDSCGGGRPAGTGPVAGGPTSTSAAAAASRCRSSRPSTGRLLGTVDGGAAHSTVHDGALYVHRGDTFVVDEFDVDDACAVVHAESPEWTTVARDVTDLGIVTTERTRRLGAVTAHTGVRRRDQPGGGLPAAPARHRRGARGVPAGPARPAAAHPRASG